MSLEFLDSSFNKQRGIRSPSIVVATLPLGQLEGGTILCNGGGWYDLKNLTAAPSLMYDTLWGDLGFVIVPHEERGDQR